MNAQGEPEMAILLFQEALDVYDELYTALPRCYDNLIYPAWDVLQVCLYVKFIRILPIRCVSFKRAADSRNIIVQGTDDEPSHYGTTCHRMASCYSRPSPQYHKRRFCHCQHNRCCANISRFDRTFSKMNSITRKAEKEISCQKLIHKMKSNRLAIPTDGKRKHWIIISKLQHHVNAGVQPTL